MSEKIFNTRIQQKHDIEVNWLKAVNFIPKIGEVIVYDPDETHAAARVKIGDGAKTVVELPFISEQADWEVNDETSAAYVKNRTHYDNSFEFTYNGNPEEYEHIEVGVAGNYWVKISSEPITKDALIGSTILLSSSTDSGLITEDFLTIDGTTICLSMFLCSVFEEYSPISGITLNRGIWISHQASMYLQSIYKFDVHQLDEKFIPSTIARVEDVPVIEYFTLEEIDEICGGYVAAREVLF